MELMYRYGGVGQAEIGKVFGQLDYTSVSRERTRLRQKLGQKRAQEGFA